MMTNVADLKAKALAAWEPIKDKWDDWDIDAKEFGQVLIDLRAALKGDPRGTFSKWLRSEGIDKNRAQYCIRVVEGKVKKAQPKPPVGFIASFTNIYKGALAAAEAGHGQHVRDFSPALTQMLNDEMERLLILAEEDTNVDSQTERGTLAPSMLCAID